MATPRTHMIIVTAILLAKSRTILIGHQSPGHIGFKALAELEQSGKIR